jgi:hypothetical protein
MAGRKKARKDLDLRKANKKPQVLTLAASFTFKAYQHKPSPIKTPLCARKSDIDG